MKMVSGSSRLPTAVAPWPVEVLQLLEEHHLCAWAHEPGRQAKFAESLVNHLGGFDDTQVCFLEGSRIVDLSSFCDQLEQTICDNGRRRVRSTIEGHQGVVEALRYRASAAGSRPLKRRYYVWRDAQVLLRRDHRLFGRLVDAIVGVAAEGEYSSEDALLIQRAVFVGAPSLDVYAEDPRGQFQTWWSEEGEDPFWQTITGVVRPRLLRYRIGEEVMS